MPKVSSIPVEKELLNQIIEQFWVSIAKIRNETDASDFFSNILTANEKIMLSKRLACAILLVREKTPSDIRDSLHLTYSTIGSIAAWLKNAKPKTRKILAEFSKEKDWETITEKIGIMLDTLPPAYETDWQEAGKQKA